MLKNNFHILSGGPGAGKTTLLEALRRRGFACVDEAARKVLKAQALIGGNATHDGDRARYRNLTLEQELADYQAMAATDAPVFFDRAMPELSGYGNAPGEGDPPALTRAIAECRYNPCVFLFPPWEAIYVHDDLRKHSFSHAIDTFENCRAAYRRHGYRIVEMPKTGVEARVDFVLHEIERGSRES